MTLTRNDLRKALQTSGFTYREARTVLNAVLESLIAEIKKSGKLELPFGTLEVKRIEPKRQYMLNKIVRRYVNPKVRFRSKNDGAKSASK